MQHLRIMAGALALILLLATSALAQGGASIFESTTPVRIGDSVRGMLLYPMGTMGIATVDVTGLYPDDMTTYWMGTHFGQNYVYDPYSAFWKPVPVDYQFATLEFQERQLEGWVRYFGGRMDRDVFIGRDGMIYKRVNITKKQRRGSRNRVRVLYTYFLNLSTLERSDGRFVPYYGMTEEDQQLVKEQSAAEEAALAQQAAAHPAFPRWDGAGAIGPPAPAVSEIVTVPAEPTEAQQRSLAELIEDEVGPGFIGPQPANTK